MDGAEQKLVLKGGREIIRRGRVYVCGDCGHTVPASSAGIR
ncbi:MAG: hypothetical protein ACREN7_07305 [Candidatus Dormibacteria bacterium]